MKIVQQKLLEQAEKKRKSDQSARQTENSVHKSEARNDASNPLSIEIFNPNNASYEERVTSDTTSTEVPRDNSATKTVASIERAAEKSTNAVKPLRNDHQCALLTKCAATKAEQIAPADTKETASMPTFDGKPLPELVTKMKSIVDKVLQKPAQLIRSSLEEVVLELLQAEQTAQKSKGCALETQRETYDELVNGVRGENLRLSVQCGEMNAKISKLIAQNAELKHVDGQTKIENIKLNAELKATNDRVTKLHDQLRKMIGENCALSAKYSESKKLNAEHTAVQTQSHQKMQEAMAKLHLASETMGSNGKDLHVKLNELKIKVDGYAGVPAELNQLRVQNQWQKERMIYMEQTFERMKSHEIAQVKKLTWCQGCGIPGDEYYCNRCRLPSVASRYLCHSPVL